MGARLFARGTRLRPFLRRKSVACSPLRHADVSRDPRNDVGRPALALVSVAKLPGDRGERSIIDQQPPIATAPAGPDGPHALLAPTLRHLERAGVPRSVAMKLTGHKTEAVYRRYAIVSEGDLWEGVAKLAALGSTPGIIPITSKRQSA